MARATLDLTLTPQPKARHTGAGRVRCVEVVVATRDAAARRRAPAGASRLVQLLPEEWLSDLRLQMGEITLLIERTPGLTSDVVRRQVQRALGDPALSAWSLERWQDLHCFRPEPV